MKRMTVAVAADNASSSCSERTATEQNQRPHHCIQRPSTNISDRSSFLPSLPPLPYIFPSFLPSSLPLLSLPLFSFSRFFVLSLLTSLLFPSILSPLLSYLRAYLFSMLFLLSFIPSTQSSILPSSIFPSFLSFFLRPFSFFPFSHLATGIRVVRQETCSS